MNRPPPLGRVFAAYFRALLLGAILLVGAVTAALQGGWPLPPVVHALYEQIAPRGPATAEHR